MRSGRIYSFKLFNASSFFFPCLAEGLTSLLVFLPVENRPKRPSSGGIARNETSLSLSSSGTWHQKILGDRPSVLGRSECSFGESGLSDLEEEGSDGMSLW